MIIVLSLAAALSGQTAPPAPPPPPPQVEREVRIVRVGGPDDEPTGGAAKLDKDGDGFITREEYVGPTSEAFRVLDRNADGRVSIEELAEGRGTARVILGGEGPAGGPASVRVFGGPGGPGGPDRPMAFTMRREGGEGGPPIVIRTRRGEGPHGEGPGDLDKDGDGKVSEEEFLAPLRDAFRGMDKDRSGALEAGEHGDGPNIHVVTRRIERSGV